MNLSILKEQDNETVIIYLSGEIDAHTATDLRNQIIPLAECPGQHMIVDFSNVKYIDSTGLGVFIGALKAMDKHDGVLTLKGMSERVHRLFAITGLDELITINQGEKEGLK